MSEVIRTIIIMSISGSIVAALLFALKPLVRNRLPKSVQYYMWLVVVAALLLPVSKLIVLPDNTAIPIAPIQAVVEQSILTSAEKQETAFLGHNLGTEGLSDYSARPDMGSPRTHVTVVTVLMYIYPLGAAATLLYFLISYLVFTRLHRRRNQAANADETSMLSEICGNNYTPLLHRNPLATTPMLFGVFRPAIIIPDREYTDAQLLVVLLHELTHLRRKDILVKWLSVLSCAVHWFNPIVWLVRREIDRACELACDEAVISSLDAEGKQNYGETLIYVAADLKTPHAILSTTMCEEKKALKERLGAIIKSKKHTRIALISSAALILAVSGTAIALGAGRANVLGEPPTTTTIKSEQNDIDWDVGENKWDAAPSSNYSMQTGSYEPPYQPLDEPQYLDPPPVSSGVALSPDILDKIYLGMTNEEVHDLFGEPDYQASGLMWYGYNDVGRFDPSFSSTGVVEGIFLNDGTNWSVNALINTAVIQHNAGKFYEPDGIYPTESHVVLALDANPLGFTAYIMSLYMTYLPDGDYNVKDIAGQHVPLALTFKKNQNGNYALTEYWQAEDGSFYTPSIRSKFPENIWNMVDTQLYIQASDQNCLNTAMYHFVGAVPSSGRFGIGVGVAEITDYAESLTPDGEFLIKYFPGATLSIEKYDEAYSTFPPGNWIVEYADSTKNIAVGRDGMAAIPITDDLFGIYNVNDGKYDMKFEKYTRSE